MIRKRIQIIVGILVLTLFIGGLLSGEVLASDSLLGDAIGVMAVDPDTLTLKESIDTVNWEQIIGTLATGYSMVLDPVNTYEYIDIESMTASPNLSDGFHEFYFDAFRAPDGFYDYWAAQGVVDGATGWQGIMWDIISGEQPMFYLNAASGTYSLVDGFQYQFDSTVAPLRVNGDYPLGTYHFGGWVTDVDSGTEYLNIQITFTKEATVSITPESSTIDGCGYLDVYIHLADVHDLYAVDIALEFDETILEVVDLDTGDTEISLEPIDTWFQAGYWVYNEADNTEGTIRYTATQQRTTDPVDGEGDIAKIRLRAKSIGTSDITITQAELSDRDGYLVGRPVTEVDATVSTQFSAAAGADLDITRLNPSTVQLSWPEQTVDEDAEYNLYKSTLPYFDISDTGVETITTGFVEGGGTVTYDDAVLGDVVNNYFYALRVVCSNGFTSPVTDQVGKFEFELFETPTTDLTIIGYVLENPDLANLNSQGTEDVADMNDLGKYIEENIYETVNVDVISISNWNPSGQSFTSYGYPSSNPFPLVMKQPYRIAIDIEGDYSPYGSVTWAQIGKLPPITQADYELIETATSDYVWILQPLEMSEIINSSQLADRIELDTENNVNVLAVSAWNGIAQSWTTSSIATRFGYPYRITVDIVGTEPIYYWP